MGFALNTASSQKLKPTLGIIMKISVQIRSLCPSWISLAVLGPSVPEEDVAEYSSLRRARSTIEGTKWVPQGKTNRQVRTLWFQEYLSGGR